MLESFLTPSRANMATERLETSKRIYVGQFMAGPRDSHDKTDIWKETTMNDETVEELVVNVDLKPVPALTFDFRITWCAD